MVSSVHGQCSDSLFITVVTSLYGLVTSVLLAGLHRCRYIMMSVYDMLSDIMTHTPVITRVVCLRQIVSSNPVRG